MDVAYNYHVVNDIEEISLYPKPHFVAAGKNSNIAHGRHFFKNPGEYG